MKEILTKEVILREGKDADIYIGFDPLTYEYTDINTDLPYTGLVYSLYDEDNIESYCYYNKGVEDKIHVEFYFDNKVKLYYEIKYNLMDGEYVEYNEDGKMIYQAEMELGVEKRYKKWDEEGNLIEEKKEPTKEDLEKIAEIKRRINRRKKYK